MLGSGAFLLPSVSSPYKAHSEYGYIFFACLLVKWLFAKIAIAWKKRLKIYLKLPYKQNSVHHSAKKPKFFYLPQFANIDSSYTERI